MDIFLKLFDPTGFVPRAQCGDWTRGLIWLHNASDFFIWTAYLAIPVVLLAFARKRRNELPFRQLFGLFGLFILACGTAHFLDIVLFYYPVYRLAGVVKFSTAAASWGTVLALIPIVPRALAMRTPEALEREIAERVRVGEELRRSEERFRASFQYAAIGKALVDLDGHWMEVNPALCQLVGYSESELLALTFQDITHPDDLDDDREQVQQLLAGTRDSYQMEKRYLHKQGHEVWSLLSVSLVHDRQHRPLHFISEIQDISARKQAETLRQQMNEMLEQRVAERTTQLAEAKAEAEHANRAKSQLLSRTSHELRTPLNAILGFSQLLEMGDLDEKQRRSVELILKGGRHQLALVDRILDVAHIESQQLKVELEILALSEILPQALEAVRALAAEREVQLRLEKSAALAQYVLADRARLLQVLANLLSNAIRFNSAGGEVSVSCHIAANDDRLCIAVSDSGRGIAPAELKHLFTLFERLGADEAGIEGTGIGLALARGLVRAMNGTLSVESNPGQGSTFTIELPMAPSLPESSVGQSGDTIATLAASTADEAVVLYIEDNLSNLELVQFILQQRPATRVLAAMYGQGGLEIARAQKPDLILLDLQLPDIDGSELLRVLHEDKATHAIPVIIISADATPGQVARLKAAGARDYLTKPLDIEEFRRAVDENLTSKVSTTL